jgi:hypothetical protein
MDVVGQISDDSKKAPVAVSVSVPVPDDGQSTLSLYSGTRLARDAPEMRTPFVADTERGLFLQQQLRSLQDELSTIPTPSRLTPPAPREAKRDTLKFVPAPESSGAIV